MAGKVLALPADLRQTEPARKIGSSRRYLHWAQQSYRAGKREEKEGDFDLFIASPNQLQTHWTALTLISFCSTSPLGAFILITSIRDWSLLNKKVPTVTHFNKAKEASVSNWGCWLGWGVGDRGGVSGHFSIPLYFSFRKQHCHWCHCGFRKSPANEEILKCISSYIEI